MKNYKKLIGLALGFLLVFESVALPLLAYPRRVKALGPGCWCQDRGEVCLENNQIAWKGHREECGWKPEQPSPPAVPRQETQSEPAPSQAGQAGDAAWGDCKTSGGSDGDCTKKAQDAYVAQEHKEIVQYIEANKTPEQYYKDNEERKQQDAINGQIAQQVLQELKGQNRSTSELSQEEYDRVQKAIHLDLAQAQALTQALSAKPVEQHTEIQSLVAATMASSNEAAKIAQDEKTSQIVREILGEKGLADGVCPADVRQCPDGSYVGRLRPSCEFASCPQPPPTGGAPEEPGAGAPSAGNCTSDQTKACKVDCENGGQDMDDCKLDSGGNPSCVCKAQIMPVSTAFCEALTQTREQGHVVYNLPDGEHGSIANFGVLGKFRCESDGNWYYLAGSSDTGEFFKQPAKDSCAGKPDGVITLPGLTQCVLCQSGTTVGPTNCPGVPPSGSEYCTPPRSISCAYGCIPTTYGGKCGEKPTAGQPGNDCQSAGGVCTKGCTGGANDTVNRGQGCPSGQVCSKEEALNAGRCTPVTTPTSSLPTATTPVPALTTATPETQAATEEIRLGGYGGYKGFSCKYRDPQKEFSGPSGCRFTCENKESSPKLISCPQTTQVPAEKTPAGITPTSPAAVTIPPTATAIPPTPTRVFLTATSSKTPTKVPTSTQTESPSAARPPEPENLAEPVPGEVCDVILNQSRQPNYYYDKTAFFSKSGLIYRSCQKDNVAFGEDTEIQVPVNTPNLQEYLDQVEKNHEYCSITPDGKEMQFNSLGVLKDYRISIDGKCWQTCLGNDQWSEKDCSGAFVPFSDYKLAKNIFDIRVFAQETTAAAANLLPLEAAAILRYEDEFLQLLKGRSWGSLADEEKQRIVLILSDKLAQEPIQQTAIRINEKTVRLTTDQNGRVTTPFLKGVHDIRIVPIEGVDILTNATLNLGPKSSSIVDVGIKPGEGRVLALVEVEPKLWENPVLWLKLKYQKILEWVKDLIPKAKAQETTVKDLSFILFYDKNGNGKRDNSETDVPWAGVTVELEEQTNRVSSNLLEGWNLVHIPFIPGDIKSAADLMLDVARSGGYVTTVAVWENDAWKEYTQRGEVVFGNDFAIEPGRAYLLRNHKETSWIVVGHPVTGLEKPLSYQLQRGWNGIGIVKEGYTSSSVLDNINQGIENATEIDRWESGLWDPFVKRIYSPDNIQEYGNNFPIEATRGYLLKLKEETTWTP